MDRQIITTGTSTGATFDMSILAGQLAPSSIARYTLDFTAYAEYAGSQLLDASTFARWRTHLATETSMSPNTINRMLSAVKRMMHEAAVQGYITHEQAEAFKHVDGVKVSALKDRTKQNARTRITPESMRELTEAPNTLTLVGLRDSALLHTLASSGLRASELASLTQAQIRKTDKGYLLSVRGKNETEYEDAYLSETAYTAIERWLDARQTISPYIFTSFAGRGDTRATHEHMTEVAVWQTVKKYADKIGLSDVKPHDLRRFVGTQLAREDIRKAQKALRHKRIETTARHYVLDELEAGLTNNLY
jgi:integrase/recombinase XerD